MRQSAWICYTIVGLIALVPPSLKGFQWLRSRWGHQQQGQPVDEAMARAGHELFERDWQQHDKLSGGDGLGPVYNATSCGACHSQNGLGGSGGTEFNVTTFTVRTAGPNGEEVREGVVHAFATDPAFQENLAHVAPNMPEMVRPSLTQLIAVSRSGHCTQVTVFPRGVHVSQRNTPALWGARLIDGIPDSAIIANEKRQRLKWGLTPSDSEELPVGRAVRLANGRVGRFGWKAQSPGLSAFVQAACANELGLGNPGQAQPKPMGKSDYECTGLDLTLEQCDQLTAFCASLPRPAERLPADEAGVSEARAGKAVFQRTGCADCHTPDVGGVEGLYSDLLVHRMGQDLEGGGSYGDPPIPVPDGPPDRGPSAAEWRTPPLWGVADSAPYMHDGRAPTLEDAIRLHGGQAARSAKKFQELSPPEQAQLVAFLKTLRAP
jgi:CxxC motif-containing protein (DUF1111 family)